MIFLLWHWQTGELDGFVIEHAIQSKITFWTSRMRGWLGTFRYKLHYWGWGWGIESGLTLFRSRALWNFFLSRFARSFHLSPSFDIPSIWLFSCFLLPVLMHCAAVASLHIWSIATSAGDVKDLTDCVPTIGPVPACLVDRLRQRYGAKGQAETFQAQLYHRSQPILLVLCFHSTPSSLYVISHWTSTPNFTLATLLYRFLKG